MRIATLACLLLATGSVAQTSAAPPTPPPGPIAFERAETHAPAMLRVTSAAFANGAAIPQRYSRYYANVSPPLRWSGAPARTRSYVLTVDDPDGRIKPVTHWIAWDLTATSLPEGLLNGPRVGLMPLNKRPASVFAQGITTMRTVGYAGPRPPLGDPAHHYHFQVFALDRQLGLAPGADREALLAAMRGHVLAKGETVGLYAQAAAPATP